MHQAWIMVVCQTMHDWHVCVFEDTHKRAMCILMTHMEWWCSAMPTINMCVYGKRHTRVLCNLMTYMKCSVLCAQNEGVAHSPVWFGVEVAWINNCWERFQDHQHGPVDMGINKNDKDGLKCQIEGLCNVIETCSRRQYLSAKWRSYQRPVRIQSMNH